ncbi:DUF4031 domain-containing protein [Leucobacter sp. W1478]|uniref:DUF4031 domain-containing protein n=1 Tax=Leucobacter sp. W1478 TaxID=3439065 RepID=UPI003F319D8E
MAILIDPPQWPAHGTLWSHLVSDTSYPELHAFASRLGVPRRSFDLDHYDVPASLYEQAIALGARPVLARDIVFQLRTSGLRVRQIERDAVRPVRRREYLVAEWAGLADALGLGGSTRAFTDWQYLGADLLARWNEPHRVYHDERHLEDVLLALDHLSSRGERISPATLLAAWFHDAVYEGASGSDEQDSAQLAAATLQELGLAPGQVQHVGELIIATTPALPHTHTPAPLAHLLDADLSIFASPASRYTEYSLAVRSEYAHVAEPEFRAGRSRILTTYLDQPSIYRTDTARVLWEERARGNLVREVEALRGVGSLAD